MLGEEVLLGNETKLTPKEMVPGLLGRWEGKERRGREDRGGAGGS